MPKRKLENQSDENPGLPRDHLAKRSKLLQGEKKKQPPSAAEMMRMDLFSSPSPSSSDNEDGSEQAVPYHSKVASPGGTAMDSAMYYLGGDNSNSSLDASKSSSDTKGKNREEGFLASASIGEAAIGLEVEASAAAGEEDEELSSTTSNTDMCSYNSCSTTTTTTMHHWRF